MSNLSSQQDNLTAYITAGVVVVVMSAVFVLFWNQNKGSHFSMPDVAYAQMGPYQVETQNFEISASVMVQTDSSNARWARENKSNLDTIFKMVLARTNPQEANGENAVEVVQNALRDEVNRDFHTDNVDAVLLTDFSLRRRD